ncbi:S-adenosyl-L-methionine-dependent methyltransferase [Venustampulla echinocandica]|uniref:S-adenosyl-L-methionine-dependent methyltransferase n=1 Tax=Venustampulla echinocandica TaxID=2656787 RepID=A0A370U1K1_9HELO|nr:S-adenosyl-L-methionine-dependent methyltransferase [Venustampulla echinocandica]RDL41662.1 S-adenosyl-L-methionine-dependent methyltransferase [Venustampulla echinocandica]
MDALQANDSAISVAATNRGVSANSAEVAPSNTNTKPDEAQSSPAMNSYFQLSPEDQAIQDLEHSSAAQQAQDGIDVDSGTDGQSVSDAGYETDSIGTGTTSLASSIRNYAFENGRRYHRFREGAYNFPNDDSEQEREDMKHAMVVNLCQELHYAPIGSNPQNILDLGTGTGIWAIEMGEIYPSAAVMGVDLSPIQPRWLPPNVRFMVDDVESEWLKPANYYDYVHGRNTVMAIKNWPKLMATVLDHLKPGGWFELQEIYHFPQCHDNSMPVDNMVAQYWEFVAQGLANLGVNFKATLLLTDMMHEAGFTNVSTRVFHVPIGVWPKNKVLKQVGLYWRTILMDGLEPIALGPFTRGLGWSKAQVDVYLVEVRKAYMDNSVHSHMPLYIICGQKPM